MPNKPDVVMRSLLAKLYSILTGGDDTAPAPADRFIAWCAPGIPIDPDDLSFAAKGLAGKDPEQTKHMLRRASHFARLVNFVPDPSGVYDAAQQSTTYEQRGNLLWTAYENALRYSEVADGTLDDATKAKLEKFRGLLVTTKEVRDIITDEVVKVSEDGPVLKAYKEKFAVAMDAITTYNNKRISAMNSDSAQVVQDWALNADNYRRRVRVAMDDWISHGYKNEVDQMRAFIQHVTQRDLTLWKRNLEEQFEGSRLTDLDNAQFFYTSFIPAQFATGNAGWTEFSFSESNSSTYNNSSTNAWSAGLSGSKGLFSAKASTKGSIEKTDQGVDTSGFEMRFELAQVVLSRAWFSTEFVENTAWRFAKGKGMSALSNGAEPPAGQMVAYPTAVILARNIHVDFAELHKKQSDFSRSIEAELEASYGPFSLSGSYQHGTKRHKLDVSKSAQGLEVKGMQIVGFKCAVLPKSPNPDSSIDKFV